LTLDFLPHFRICQLHLLNQKFFVFLLKWSEDFRPFVAVSAPQGQHHVIFEASLRDWERVQAEGKSFGSQFLLPLRKVGSFNGRHSVALLPFSQVILVAFRVKTHHKGLSAEDIRSDKGRL